MVEACVKVILLSGHALLTFAFLSAWHAPFWARLFSIEDSFQFHLLSALSSVLIGLFANLCVIFYFVGTGVWMRERAREVYVHNKAAGERAWACYTKAAKLKGKSFPFATLALVLIMFTFILGGAMQVAAIPHWLHPTLAASLVALSWFGVKPIFRAIDVNLTYLDMVSTELESTPQSA